MLSCLRVGHEHNSVHATKNQLAAGIVKHLSRDGIQVNPVLNPAPNQIQRQEVKEQRRSVSVASEIILPFCSSAVFW